jgi:HSP20 family protein
MRATGVAKASTPAVRLNPTSPAQIEWEVQQLQIGIARRAFELFEMRGGEHGHDWEDWFRAESELLRPVSVAISESNQRISVRLNVLGFDAAELKVSVEPSRITILGAKRSTPAESEYPDQTFRVIELPAEVNPDAAAIVFESGVLKVELFKATMPRDKSNRQSA